MADCSWEQLLDEWSRSAAVLAEELGGPVPTASVPGGLYSKARRPGRRGGRLHDAVHLPAQPARRLDRRLPLIGRYAIRRDTTAGEAAAAAAGKPARGCASARPGQLRGAAKAVAGRRYESVRRALLARR